MVKEKKQHFTARIPESLVERINKEAKSRGITVTAIVEEAFRVYFKDDLPGLCPNCHTQNAPEAKFCMKCGLPFNPEERENFVTMIELLKKIKENPEEFETHLKNQSRSE